jgi:hypothetical protein
VIVSASSNAGFDGGFVARKSSIGSTMPRPIRWYQMRLTCVWANRALSGLVSHSANSTSRSESRGSGWAPSPKKRGGSGSPVRGLSTEPRGFR